MLIQSKKLTEAFYLGSVLYSVTGAESPRQNQKTKNSAQCQEAEHPTLGAGRVHAHTQTPMGSEAGGGPEGTDGLLGREQHSHATGVHLLAVVSFGQQVAPSYWFSMCVCVGA